MTEKIVVELDRHSTEHQGSGMGTATTIEGV